MADPVRLIDIRHPHWSAMSLSWKKWRSIFCGGDRFIEDYTKKYSEIEDEADFKRRKSVTPCPAFAKSAVNDVIKNIFQRMADVTRRGGSQSYQDAVEGKGNGVDLHGKSMNQFMGTEVVPELAAMACVGIFVDMPPLAGPSVKDQMAARPYIYAYKAEEIYSWSWRKDHCNEFQAVLLRDWVDTCCPTSGLPTGQWSRWRHIWLGEDKKVHVQCYNDKCEMVDATGEAGVLGEYILDIDFIPFVILEINDSLLSDIANHQIALLNLESADMGYSLKSNVPIYTEQSDGRAEMFYMRGPDDSTGDGSAEAAETSTDKSIKVGVNQGRRYAPNMDRPGFIHPSPEPLRVSMEKQKNLKDDIRTLINLALSNVKPKMASAESKAIDERGLEAGLSHIGLVLEHAENKIAKIWAAYEGGKGTAATVSYPKNYSLQTDANRREEVKGLEELRDSIPSPEFAKAVSKRIVDILLGGKESTEVIDKIKKEIEKSNCVTYDHDKVIEMVEAGICSKDLAEKIFGLPEGTASKAEKEHTDRLAAIAEHQAAKNESTENPAARGNPDAAADPVADAADEKKGKPKRGEGK